MDLRVGERLLRPASDTAFLSALHPPLHPPLLIGPFSPQHCSQYSQPQLQRLQQYNMEQHLQEQEQAKQQLQQLKHKDKSQQSAVASALVKQKLAQVILKKQKQQAVLERTNSNPLSPPSVPYRELVPDPSATIQPLLPSTKATLTDGASEPNLKVKHKLKKHLNTRKSPLTRKESAPPSVKHRVPETLDSSPSSSSTPVSGCSSPNDSLPNENGVSSSLCHEAQRLLLQDGSLSHFTIQSASSLPTITLGLPANSKAESDLGAVNLPAVPLVPSGSSPLLLPLSVEEASTAHTHTALMQPVLILEPSALTLHTPLLAVPGVGRVPLQLSASAPHKALSRTRSEPLPQSPGGLHAHSLQHSAQILHRLKQHTHLGKLMSKSSEKPRLRQIPSEDMDSEEAGSMSGDSHTKRGRVESQRERESQEEQLNLQHALILNQSHLWETQKQLQQLRRQTAHMETLAVPMMLSSTHRPLARTQSSPASTSLTMPEKTLPAEQSPTQPRFTTGLVYDSQMLKHQCACGDNSSHPEHAGRIQSIWSRLQERGLRGQVFGEGKPHWKSCNQSTLSTTSFCMAPTLSTVSNWTTANSQVDNDTIWNEMHTSTASRLAAGSVTELAFRVAKGELKNGFAVVRPPGHHADPANPMGFCFFNSVAIAAKQLQQKLSVSKILIVDWDVHHGNGTQEIFYRDPNVLYISLHRYDNGNFFPGSGGPAEVGSGAGEGFNVNVAWTGDVVLVSSGFDAAEGHPAPLGGYKVTAKCFGFLTHQLMTLAGGRVVLALEGGHDLTAICDASEACVSALLGIQEPLPESTLLQAPCANAVLSLQRLLNIHSQYWSSLKPLMGSIGLSFLAAQKSECEETDTLNAMASLSVAVLTTSTQL
ncbi:hypothetical protein DNTS_034455, partial [Danionella cerebrum]